MSSPIRKRSALVGKNVNVSVRPKQLLTKSNTSNGSSRSASSSPLRRSHTPDMRQSPVKRLSSTPSPLRRRQNSSIFSFHEEKEEARNNTIKSHKTIIHKNDNKENEKSKDKNKKAEPINKALQRQGTRTQLGELDPVEFPGYIQNPSSSDCLIPTVPYVNSANNSNNNSPSRLLHF